jgi:hypothetical protein
VIADADPGGGAVDQPLVPNVSGTPSSTSLTALLFAGFTSSANYAHQCPGVQQHVRLMHARSNLHVEQFLSTLIYSLSVSGNYAGKGHERN